MKLEQLRALAARVLGANHVKSTAGQLAVAVIEYCDAELRRRGRAKREPR